MTSDRVRDITGPFDNLNIPVRRRFTGGMTEKSRNSNRSTSQEARESARAALAERAFDFVALVSLLAAVTTVFLLAGSQAFAAVTSVGTGLFAAWRGHRRQN